MDPVNASKSLVWVCGQCGGKFWPQVVVARGQCPSCGNREGKEVKLTDEERNAGS